jgi:hypothetical protein
MSCYTTDRRPEKLSPSSLRQVTWSERKAYLCNELAEGEGFEPSRRCYRLRDFQSRALGQAMRPFQIGQSVFGYQTSDDLRHCVFGTWLIADNQVPTARRGGEGGIRTHGGSSPHRFSRAAPSTTRTPLQLIKYTNAVSPDGARTAMRTAKPPGGYRAAY